MYRRSRSFLGSLIVMALAGSSLAMAKQKRGARPAAEPPPAPTPSAEEAKEQEAAGRPKIPTIEGPKKVDLGNDVELDLPAGMLFVERPNAKPLMERMGNVVGDDFIGLVLKQKASWLVTVSFVGDGYVKDDDAADLDPEDILDSIREGTEEANEFRVQRGFGALHVDGWTEQPRYERDKHHLVWGVKATDADGASINFYTRKLGRRGYVALNLIDDPAAIEASKVETLAVLRATSFKPGARYEDFDGKNDKIAEYGLAALVAGGAGAAALKLAKVGLLAKFGGKLIALILAGKKVLIPLVLLVGAGVRKLLGLRKREPVAPAPELAMATGSGSQPPPEPPAPGAPAP